MKKFVFLALLPVLYGCTTYSNEMVLFYDDNNAEADVAAAPSKPISSEQLVIPEDLRNKNKDEKSEQTSSLNKGALQQPESTKLANKAANKSSAQELIPMTYEEETKTTVEVSETTTDTQTNVVTSFSADEISPKVYAIVATRVTNQMLDETQQLYSDQENKPKLLVLKTKKLNSALPDGLNYANKNIYDIINGSQNFVLVDKLDNADFQLEATVDAMQNPNASTPVIVYTLTLKDKDGKEIDSWTKDIRQLQNDDKSWW